MVEIASIATGAIQGATTGGAAAGGTTSPGADALARFEAAMGGAQGGTPAAGPPGGEGQSGPDMQQVSSDLAPPAEPLPGAVPPAGGSPGDAILRGLENMSKGFNGAIEQLNHAVSSVKPGEMMSASDLMRLQFSLTQISVQQDVTGKVVGKATQNLDTFLKNQ